MKKSHYSESKIISILKQHESRVKIGDICREHGISQATFFNWRAKYGGMSSSQLKRLKLFLHFVLDQYVQVGVDELDESKLPDLLELEYYVIADAKEELGDIKVSRDTFIGFQEYLYKQDVI